MHLNTILEAAPVTIAENDIWDYADDIESLDVYPAELEKLTTRIKTVPLLEAVKEKGFIGNQNSVAQPKARIWNVLLSD